MRVGSYKGIDLQGGMFYPTILENLAAGVVWAFNSKLPNAGRSGSTLVDSKKLRLILDFCFLFFFLSSFCGNISKAVSYGQYSIASL
jgi:hypothetical protein